MYKGWNVFTTCFVPYFKSIFGLKFQAIAKLQQIKVLQNLLKTCSVSSPQYSVVVTEMVTLMYSLTDFSASRRIGSVKEKLDILNVAPVNIPDSVFKNAENTAHLSFVWVLGFFLGDGSLFVTLNWSTVTKFIYVVPTITLRQKMLSSNEYIINLISSNLTSLGIINRLGIDQAVGSRYDGDHTRPSTIFVKVEGIKAILTLIPHLTANLDLLFWKIDQYNTVIWVSRVFSINTHKTSLGLLSLIHFLFNQKQVRLLPISVWLN